MGKRGPKPKPKAALQSWRAEQRQELSVPISRPDAPAFLSETGAKVWDYVTAQMEIIGTLSVIDLHLLSRYAATMAHWLECERQIQGDMGLFKEPRTDTESVTEGPNGTTTTTARRLSNSVLSPALIAHMRLNQELLRMEDRLGLSPASRVGLANIHADTQNKKASAQDKYIGAMKKAGNT